MRSAAVATVFVIDDDRGMRQAIHDLVESVGDLQRSWPRQALKSLSKISPGGSRLVTPPTRLKLDHDRGHH